MKAEPCKHGNGSATRAIVFVSAPGWLAAIASATRRKSASSGAARADGGATAPARPGARDFPGSARAAFERRWFGLVGLMTR